MEPVSAHTSRPELLERLKGVRTTLEASLSQTKSLLSALEPTADSGEMLPGQLWRYILIAVISLVMFVVDFSPVMFWLKLLNYNNTGDLPWLIALFFPQTISAIWSMCCHVWLWWTFIGSKLRNHKTGSARRSDHTELKLKACMVTVITSTTVMTYRTLRIWHKPLLWLFVNLEVPEMSDYIRDLQFNGKVLLVYLVLGPLFSVIVWSNFSTVKHISALLSDLATSEPGECVRAVKVRNVKMCTPLFRYDANKLQ